MNHASLDIRRALEVEIQAHGVDRWFWQNTGGDHLLLCFMFKGRLIRHSVSRTPGDRRRAHHRALSQLRRQMGVKRIITKNPDRQRREPPPEPAPRIPTCAAQPKPDPWAALREHPMARGELP